MPPRRFSPHPSRVELTTELREAATIAEQKAAQAREAYFFDHPELATGDQDPDVFFREVVASEAEIASVLAPLFERFDQRAEQRARLVKAAQYLSPAILTQRLLSGIAGTSDERYSDFRASVVAFHDDYQRFFTQRLMEGELVSASDLEKLPRFAYRAEPRSVASIALPLGTLLIMTIALVAIALPRYPKCPVTAEASQA